MNTPADHDTGVGHDSGADLPELSEESIERIETALFTRIAEESGTAGPADDSPVQDTGAQSPAASHPAPHLAPRRARRRRWALAGSVAAAFVLGIAIVPVAQGLMLSTTAGSGAMIDAAPYPASREFSAGDMAVPEMMAVPMDDFSGAGNAPLLTAEGALGSMGVEVITHASASLRVEDVRAAADALSALAVANGGAVESLQLGSLGSPVPYTVTDATAQTAVIDYGWLSIRVPSDRVDETLAALGDTGEVLSTSINASDVTSVAIDLRARISSLQASVERLTDLMAQSGSVGDLIQAESALSERQAQLESYQQQLADLESRVAMSSIHIDLSRTPDPTTAEPGGFWDGLAAGWAGMLVSLNAVVIALGFALPWLVLAGVVVLVVRLIVRRRRRSNPDTEPAETAPEG